MSPTLSPAQRAKLLAAGVDPDSLRWGNPVALPQVADQAFVAPDVGTSLSVGPSPVQFARIGAAIVYTDGRSLDTLLVESELGGLRVELARSSEAISSDKSILFEIRSGDVVLVYRAGQPVLLVARNDRSLSFAEGAATAGPPILGIPSLSVNAPVWLREAVALASGGKFPRPLEAAGLRLRFDASSDPAMQRARRNAMLAGEDDPAWVPVRNWWLGVLESERIRMLAVAATRAIDLGAELERLGTELEASEEWIAGYAHACRVRDTLASERAALVAVSANDPLDTLLEPVDHAGRSLSAKLPFIPEFVDPVLSELRRGGLDAWWFRWSVPREE